MSDWQEAAIKKNQWQKEALQKLAKKTGASDVSELSLFFEMDGGHMKRWESGLIEMPIGYQLKMAGELFGKSGAYALKLNEMKGVK